MSKVSDAEWLEEAARYFENRSTGGEDMAFWANVSNAERCRSIAQSLRSQPAGVRVKGLDWTRRQRRLDEWKAHTSVGMYEVGEVHGRWSAVLRYVDSDCQAEDVVVGRFDSPDEAKAAAQADYERRILSALTEQQGEDHGRYLNRDDYAASDEGHLGENNEAVLSSWRAALIATLSQPQGGGDEP